MSIECSWLCTYISLCKYQNRGDSLDVNIAICLYIYLTIYVLLNRINIYIYIYIPWWEVKRGLSLHIFLYNLNWSLRIYIYTDLIYAMPQRYRFYTCIWLPHFHAPQIPWASLFDCELPFANLLLHQIQIRSMMLSRLCTPKFSGFH